MTELMNLSEEELAAALQRMLNNGEIPTYQGARVQTCGGHGTIIDAGSGVFFQGRQIAVVGSRYQGTCVHGCQTCPHTVFGTIINGSVDFLAGGVPVALIGSIGVHAACCGPNTAHVVDGFSPADLMH